MKNIYNYTLFTIVSLLFLSCGGVIGDAYDAEDWYYVGEPCFSDGEANHVSLAFDGDTPYVAYQDMANSGKATVMKLDGDKWEAVGNKGFSAGTATYVSMVIINGTPYVGYMDGANSNQPTMMKFNGSSWALVGSAGFSAYSAYYISIAEYNGYPCIAFGSSVNVFYYNGSWTQLGNANFVTTGNYSLKLKVYNNIPYIAFSDYNNSYKASVYKYNGSAWVTVGTSGFSSGITGYIDMAVEDGTPYVAYWDRSNSDGLSVMKFNGSTWENVGNSNLFGRSLFNFISESWYRSLTINVEDGIPYVFASGLDGGEEIQLVKKFNGDSWVDYGIFTAGGKYCSIVFNRNTPYISLSKHSNNASKTTVFRYGKRDWD